MKIIELNFMNINSLKGEHRISFENVPLSNASIFAIVGPTGSGKSTILDVITLALFNRIPRFSKAISKKEISEQSSVMTHHTKEASASIEYKVQGVRYKSTWSITMNRNDKLKDYEMTFYNPDGSVADLRKSEVPAKNEEVIGLNYDQFIKAILLSQGEFSKFLKSDKNERGALLENLTGTGIYRKIGKRTYEKYKEVKQNLERENDLLGEHKTLTEEERNVLELELKKATFEKEKQDKELEKLGGLLQIKSSIGKLQASQIETQNMLSEIKQQAEAFQSKEARIQTHQKLSHLQGRYANYKAAKSNARDSKENLDKYKEELEESRKALELTIGQMATLTKKEINQDNFKNEMSAFENEINGLDKDIKHLSQSGKDARARVNQDKGNYHQLDLGDNIKPQEAINLLTQRKSELSNIIGKTSLDKTHTTEQVKAQLKKAQEEVENLKVLKQHLEIIAKAEEKRIKDKAELKEYENTASKHQPLIQKIEELLKASNTQIQLLRKQKEDALKIAELEELRDSLINGEACPLCGSLEHPYTEHLPNNTTSEIDQSIAKVEHDLIRYQKEIADHTSIIDKSKASIERITRDISEATHLLAEGKKTTMQLLSKVDKGNNIELNNITKVVDDKVASIRQHEEGLEAQSELEHNVRLIGQYSELFEIGKQYKELIKARQEKFEGVNISDIANKLQDDYGASNTNIEKLESVIKNETKSLDRDINLATKLSEELNPVIIDLGFNNLDEIESQILDEKTLDGLTTQQKTINDETIRIKSALSVIHKDLEEQQKLDTDHKLSIEALQSTIASKKQLADEQLKIASTSQEKLNRDKEDLKRFKERKQNIDKLTKEFSKWSLLNSMIGSATGNDFANFAQGLTLKNLLVYANRRLEKLSDRYLLNKPENDGALIVIDKYQGNSSRSVTTLSGGETFLMSLALALSLSDMASKNVSLGCLFIDEGFGTLDPETLELAMTTLETLQSESQKTVGVISHVETLKDRIDVQIQLDRNAQGLSSIKVVG